MTRSARYVVAFVTFVASTASAQIEHPVCTSVVSVLGIGALSAVVDMFSAPAAAARFNASHFAVAPLVDPARRTAGLAFRLPIGRTPPTRPAAPERKSEAAAFWMSFLSTVVPIAYVARFHRDDDGMFLAVSTVAAIGGPTLGLAYAGAERRAVIGGVIRAASIGGAALLMPTCRAEFIIE